MTTQSPQPPATHPSASPLTPHLTFIKDQLPEWLRHAPSALRKDFRSSLISSNQSRHDLKALLDQVQSPEEFARALLREKLHSWFFGLVDDENAILSREWKNHHLLGLIRNHAKTTRQTLLEAALQNFEASEAEADGMETGTAIVNVTKTGEVPSAVSAVSFAHFCRQLDIGGQYLKHISQILEPATNADKVRATFRAQAQHAFGVALHTAYMRQLLKPKQHLQLHSLQRGGIQASTTCSHLALNAVVLPNVLVIQALAIGIPFMLYTPEDPDTELRQHASMEELQQQLAQRLLEPGYQRFFKRLVPQQHLDNLLSVTAARLAPSELIMEQQILPAKLQAVVSLTAIQGDLFKAVAHQRIAQIKADARVLAVPTADADLLSRQKRLQGYLDLGKNLLFFAASFLPVVGEVMLIVTAAQVLDTVYEGFAAWSRGDSDEALNDLLDLVDTAAQAVVTAGAIRGVGFGARLVKVHVRNKGWRLWNADLKTYRHTDALPGHLTADSQGVYKHGQQHYLKLDDHPHAVKRTPDGTQWELSHPTDPHAYCPPLLGNGVGGWRQTHESPAGWDDLKLIKRMGPDAANITAPKVQPILLLSGVDTATLRDTHQDMLRPPALLRDTVTHFNVEQEINDFNLERAEGVSVTTHSPLIQFHLLSQLPEWPANHVLKIVGEQQQVVMSHGTGTVEIEISEARFRKGELLHALEEQMPQTEFNALLLDWYPEYFTKVENLALRLQKLAPQQKQRLLTLLTAPDGKNLSPTESNVLALIPTLSKSHLEEIEATLTPADRQSLQQDKRLTPLARWEAEQYVKTIRASRAQAATFLDSLSDRESVPLTLYNLEQLPGWPSSLKIAVYAGSRDGTRLGSIGPADARAQHTIIRQGELYTRLDAEGLHIDPPNGLLGTLEQALTETERAAIFKQSGVSSLKQASQQISLSNMTKPPAIRAKDFISHLPSPTGQPLDPLFGEPMTPAGLTLREDGIYQAPASPTGNYRYYIKDNQKYFAIKHDPAGWRLVDARSPYRFYQPYLRKKATTGWEIDNTKGALLGGGDQPFEPAPEDMETSDEFESAHSSIPYESAEEGSVSTQFTRQELRTMRSERSYQQSQNYRRIYDRANNGRYPLRDLEGRPMRIKLLQSQGKSTTSDTVYRNKDIRPYIQWEGYENVARLYEDKLEVTPFTAAHQKFPQEASLIGEATVITRRAIKKGEALGVYGGELVPWYVAMARRDPYLVPIKNVRPTTPYALNTQEVLSGDNILSRINTVFEYHADCPIRQAANGYNTEAAMFNVATQVGNNPQEKMVVMGLFAIEDIPAGGELRWNYKYDESTIRALFPPLENL